MLNFIKKYGLGFIIGAIIFGPLSYVTATTISARNVYYDGTNTNSSLTDVQAAIEQLYDKEKYISFTIDGVTYQAERGMKWSDWTNSSYNTDNWHGEGDGNVTKNDGKYCYWLLSDNTNVLASKIIIINTIYSTDKSAGSCTHHGGAEN